MRPKVEVTFSVTQRHGIRRILDRILEKLYVDFKEASKKNPCSIKFNADRVKEIIDLHKIKFNKRYGGVKMPKSFGTVVHLRMDI